MNVRDSPVSQEFSASIHLAPTNVAPATKACWEMEKGAQVSKEKLVIRE